jgi:hypothetical protein
MHHPHWLDTLGKSLGSGSSRRTLLAMSAALPLGRGPGGVASAGAAADPCDEAFLSDHDRASCRRRRRRCRGADPRLPFCILEGDPANPAKLAACCGSRQKCCAESYACCPRSSVCCTAANAGVRPCCPAGEACCASDLSGCCSAGQTCCPGAGCVDPATNRDHCGGCGQRCPTGQRCVGGRCVCPPGLKPCPGHPASSTGAEDCIPESYVCCDGWSCPSPQHRCCPSIRGCSVGACP